MEGDGCGSAGCGGGAARLGTTGAPMYKDYNSISSCYGSARMRRHNYGTGRRGEQEGEKEQEYR